MAELRLLTWSASRPRAAFGVALALTVVLGAFAARVETRYEIEGFFPQGTPERAALDQVVERFGRDDRVGVLVIDAPGRVLDAGSFAAIESLTRRLEARDDLERVISPTNALIPTRDAQGNVRLERAVVAPVTSARVAELFETFSQPPYAGALISADRGLAVVGAVLAEERLDFASRARLLASLEAEAETLAAAGLVARVAGYPMQRVRLARLAASESRRFLPAALLAILLVAAFAFRSLRAVALPAVVALVAAVWTTGLMGLSGVFPNIFGPAVYVMIVVVGVADAVHLLARRAELLSEGLHPSQAIEQSLAQVGPACFWASLTTALAFGSLVFTRIPMVVDMGLQVAAGVLCAFVVTILVFPLVAGGAARGAPGGSRLVRLSEALEGLAARRPRTVVAAFGLLFAAGAVGASQVRVNSPLLSDLDPQHPIRVTNRLLEERLTGVIPLDVVIEAPKGRRPAAYAREHVQRIDALTRRLRADPDVLWATSAADPLRRLGALLQNLPSDEVLGLLPTALLLANPQVRGWVDERSDGQRIRLRIRDLQTDEAFALFARIEAAYEHELGRPARGQLTGQGYLAQFANRAMVSQFRTGFLVALVGVACVIWLAFGSLRLALISLLPNLFPVVLVAGAMGLSGIDLRYTSALVLSVVFGLAVDDTIHVLAQLRRQGEAPDPIRATARVAGPGLILTSLFLACGFGILGLSEFLPLRVMGGLLALTALLALASDLLFLPALLRLWGPAKKS